MELGRPESYPFVHDEKVGWTCECGASEKRPGRTGDFILRIPVVTSTFWDHAVRVTLIKCHLCGREAQTSKAHDIIDITDALVKL